MEIGAQNHYKRKNIENVRKKLSEPFSDSEEQPVEHYSLSV